MKRQILFALFAIFCLPILADIPPPPSPLHRIGFEVLPNGYALLEKWLGIAGGMIFLLGVLLAVCLFFTSNLMVLRKRTKWMVLALVALFISLGGILGIRYLPPAEAWKYPNQVSADDRMKLHERIIAILPELQSRFDTEYAKLDDEGKLIQLGTDFYGGNEEEYLRARREHAIMKHNALTTITSALEHDNSLKRRCEGIPIEWILNDISCPRPSFDRNELRLRFRDWAVRLMPRNWTDAERDMVFNWQFAVAEKEGRRWKELAREEFRHAFGPFVRYQSQTLSEITGEDGDGHTFIMEGFEDFVMLKFNDPHLVENWHRRAIEAGWIPTKDDIPEQRRKRMDEDRCETMRLIRERRRY